MALVLYRNALLKIGAALASGAACCCRLWCSVIGVDECGNPQYGCTTRSDNAIRPCDPACQQSSAPCECGPNKPCDVCYECIDQRCERIEDCCEDGTPCPACSECINGECVPCGTCTKCVGGYCVPCGPCEVCENGVCVPCPEDCVNGVCVPSQYYCCWDECPNDEYGDPKDPPPSTHCQSTPCGYDPQTNCNLTKGGPYGNSNACTENCRNYDCKPNACGFLACEPDPDGPYDSLSECRDSCPEDPCSLPPSLTVLGACPSGGFPLPGQVTPYGIDACERDICVSYVSTNGRPIRVQIIAPTLDQDCDQVAVSVKSDSVWRCEECCDCPDVAPRSNSPGDCEGGPTGKITWTKPQGVQWFCVHVLSACNATYNIDVKVGENACQAYDEDDWDPCLCGAPTDCNEGCSCCNGRCRQGTCDCCPPIQEGCSYQYANGTTEVLQFGPECNEGFGLTRWTKSQLILGPFSYSDARYDGWRTQQGTAALDGCLLFELVDGNGSSGSADCGICGGVPYTGDCVAQRVDIRRRLFWHTACAAGGGPPSLEDITSWAISTGTARCPRAPCYNDPDNGCPVCDKWAGYGTEDGLPAPPDPKPDCWCVPPISWHTDTTDWISEIPQLVCDP